MRIALLLLLSLASINNWAQTYCKSYGSVGTEYAGQILAVSDGGFLLTGSSNFWGEDFMDFFVVKTDSLGDLEWSTIIQTAMEDVGKSAIELFDGSFLIAGTIFSEIGGYNVGVAHLDAAGNLLSTNRYGDALMNVGNQIVATNDGGFVIVGYSDTIGAAVWTFQPMILKLNAALEIEWCKRFSTCASCSGEATAVLEKQDGSLWVTGYIHSGFAATSSDIMAAKLDEEGNLLWLNTSGKPGKLEQGKSMAFGNNENVIITGYVVEENNDIYIASITNDGITEWQKLISDGNAEMGMDIIKTQDFGFAIAATKSSGENDFYLIKLDNDFNIEFTAMAEAGGSDYATSLIQSAKGNYLLFGHGIPEGTFADELYLLQFDSTGNNCNKTDSGGVITFYDGTYQLGGFTHDVDYERDYGGSWISGGSMQTVCADTVVLDTNTAVTDFNMDDLQVFVSPNPAADLVVVEIEQSHAIESILLLNAFGQQQTAWSYALKAENQAILRVNQLPSGLYLVQVEVSGVCKVFKLVVTRP